MTTAIDLFAGLGGWSTGARAAGVQVLWAANHWPAAVEWHSANHPDTQHVCQDLHQARWEQVPAHDILLASPCCQGHAKARGKKSGNPEHDASRSTAWAPVSAIEFHRPQAAVIENVPEFTDLVLYPAWLQAVQALGYQAAPHIVDCADLSVPQHRVRLFMVLTRSKAPLMLQLPQERHVPAASFLDLDAGRWSQIEKPGRAQATLDRVRNGRQRFGDRFIMPSYGKGSGTTGRDINRPIGTNPGPLGPGRRRSHADAQRQRGPSRHVVPHRHPAPGQPPAHHAHGRQCSTAARRAAHYRGFD